MIDGRPPGPALLELREAKVSIDRVEIRVGGNHVNVIGLKRNRVGYLLNGKRNVGLEEFCQMTFMVRGEMDHDNESETAVSRNLVQKLFECCKATG